MQHRYLDNNGAENLSFSILGENVAAVLLASGIAGASTSGSDAAYRVATVQPCHVISPDFGYAVSAFSTGWPSVKLLLQVKSVQITYELPT